MKKVELLAPAGSYESFLGAVCAGADAVYIGGRKYGARAYAENFTDEEVCLAIRYAHLYGRKLYLTVNTLLKEEEIISLPDDIRPFYEEGLDGVIVQDMGVFSLLREIFPDLPLHASTQMTVTGAGGARFLRGQGAVRVVPARELSLQEIKKIKETGIEVEAFVHGAMCYCYSGQCLFSSMLGGRSGNRGRCAQPCRLPYQVTGKGYAGKQSYPLSLKDMCTIALLPELIEAGIDSFKIEGRMKKPAYAAGVTAIYRKYIDQYYAAPKERFKVRQEDMEKLRRLYIRSEIQEGYYHRHNGREMVTPDRPGYLGPDEACLQEIRRTYLNKIPQIPVAGEMILKKKEPAVLLLQTIPGRETGRVTERHRISRKGQIVQAAQRQPLTKETVEKQLYRTGDTPFVFETLTVDMEPDVFLPVKALNDLRREGIAKLEAAMLRPHRRESRANPKAPSGEMERHTAASVGSAPYLALQVQREEQLRAVSSMQEADRLYVDSSLVLQDAAAQGRAGRGQHTGSGKALCPMLTAWKRAKKDRKLFLVMPYIVRLRDEKYLHTLASVLFSADTAWDGVMTRNLESLCWLKEKGYDREIVGDVNLYAWNRRARAYWREIGVHASVPLECSKEDLHKMGIRGMEMVVYGRSTLMVTANCIRETETGCVQGHQGEEAGKDIPGGIPALRDRYGADFPVRMVCGHCYNEIYNSVPLSLHEYGKSVMGEGPSGVRLVFTTESPAEITAVTACFEDFVREPGRSRKAGFAYTRGHYKRGAQ